MASDDVAPPLPMVVARLRGRRESAGRLALLYNRGSV